MQSCCIGLFWLLASLYEVVQNSADRGFFLDHRPGGAGKNFYLRCSAPLCKQKLKSQWESLEEEFNVGSKCRLEETCNAGSWFQGVREKLSLHCSAQFCKQKPRGF